MQDIICDMDNGNKDLVAKNGDKTVQYQHGSMRIEKPEEAVVREVLKKLTNKIIIFDF